MSIKIYTAFQLKDNADLWPLVHDIRVKATKRAKKHLENLYLSLMSGVDTSKSLYQSRFNKTRDDWKARHGLVHEVLRRAYRLACTSAYRSPFNFDVSVGFRQYKGRIYVIPYCDWHMGSVLDFLKKDPRLQDFCYYNNTDRPPHVSARDWARRRKVWEGMDASGQWQDVLGLDICKWDIYHAVDPWLDMYQKHVKAARKSKKPRNAS